MSLFDLLFVALVLAGIASLLAAAVSAGLGRRVDGVHREEAAGGATLVDLHLASRARRVTQREVGLELSLLDASGESHEPVPDASDVPLDTPLAPGQSVAATRRFALPAGARATGLVVAHGGFPIRWFLIGEGPFREPPIVRLDPFPD